MRGIGMVLSVFAKTSEDQSDLRPSANALQARRVRFDSPSVSRGARHGTLLIVIPTPLTRQSNQFGPGNWHPRRLGMWRWILHNQPGSRWCAASFALHPDWTDTLS